MCQGLASPDHCGHAASRVRIEWREEALGRPRVPGETLLVFRNLWRPLTSCFNSECTGLPPEHRDNI